MSAFDAPLSALQGAWPTLVGPVLARASRPAAIDGDVLIVQTDSSEWSHQLAFLEPEIVRANPGISRLRFRIVPRPGDPARYEFDVVRSTKTIEPRVKGEGRFMLADEVLPVIAALKDELQKRTLCAQCTAVIDPGADPVAALIVRTRERDVAEAEVKRLEKMALDADGYRCDGCQRVFDTDDGEHHEDCFLCTQCSQEARNEMTPPHLRPVPHG